MEKQISGRGNSVPNARPNFAKRMELRGSRRSEELIPGIGPERHDAGEAAVEIAKIHCAYQRGQVTAKSPDDVEMLGSPIYFENQKDRGRSQRRGYRLRFNPRRIGTDRRAHCL